MCMHTVSLMFAMCTPTNFAKQLQIDNLKQLEAIDPKESTDSMVFMESNVYTTDIDNTYVLM